MRGTHKALRATAVILAGALALAPSSCFRNCDSQHADSKEPMSLDSFLPQPAFAHAATNGGVSIADVAEQALPSVVSISATKISRRSQMELPFFNDPFFRRFFGPWNQIPQERLEKGLGSGVIVSEDGVVLTNHHVVDGADSIEVTTPDDRSFEADVAGSDPKSDLAVIKLKGDVKGLHPIAFGDSGRLRLGDVVLAIGNPFGVGQTVTMGIVSATGRANVGITDYEDFIQTDAAINPGNSGGALVSMEGKLVGINTAILSRSGGYQGIGFAIPSNMARPIMDSLLEHGKVVRGWLGVVIQDVDEDLSKALGLDSTKGVLVSDVSADGPAAKAGVERGDVILKVNGKEVNSTGKLRNAIAGAGAGAKVKLELLRSGKRKTLEVNLGELPEDVALQPGVAKPSATRGLVVAPINEAHKRRFDLPASLSKGVVVLEVKPNSPAAKARIKPGDVIVQVAKKDVNTPRELQQRLVEAKGRVLLLIQRGEHTLFTTLGEG